MGMENYELGESLVVSPPSTFFQGRNAVLGNEVVLRRLTIDPSRAENVRETFFREQRLSARLHHPHIQRAIDAFEADGYLWSVHESYTAKLTSELVAQEGPMPLAEAARLGSQLAEALSHMHAQDVIHGRVSPGLTVLDERGDVVLISLVKAADLEAGIWPLRPAVLGLSPFSAPEEFCGEKPDASSDLYGLAATVFYWLTGEVPRGGECPESALLRAGDAESVSDLLALRGDASRVLAEHLEAALAARPQDRRGSVATLGSVLLEIHQRHAAEVPSGFTTGCILRPPGLDQGVEIIGRHGAGAFGVVLRARDGASQEIVAIKALKPEHRENQDAHERFLREARSMQQIQHANVVGIRGVGEENGTPFTVMEFVDGPDLATVLLREGTLSFERVARLGAALARGLQAIHEQGIIHRDLKPHNVLVAANDSPIITDFGIAREVEASRLTMTGQFAGTPVYMAPEQIAGAEPTHAIDLYALGNILYELMTGHLPFTASDALSAMTAIRDLPLPSLPNDIPKVLGELTTRLLAKSPADRPESAQAVAEALETALSGCPGEVP